ncbi:uncharacterized protein LOC126687266 [Mercurialis annua]|uniref:uncharacterized protein LOC126687266 n=1 Tax=Mercurialis annua TaxID=3986 RepID=UPI002160CA60|nr:uncharacterized protein LOC126687266 [Mercurialis annua]
MNGRSGAATSGQNGGLVMPWKNVWALNLPPKIKHFVWRTLRFSLPTKGAIQHRTKLGDGRCPRCGDYESLDHVFKDCSWARSIWNQLCFSGNDIPWDIIIAQASRIRLDFQEVNQEKKETRGDVAAYWINPDNGWIKINSDAGFSKVNSWRLGFVGRDNDGEVLIAGNKTMNKGLSIIEAEGEALLWALKTAKECGLDSVIAESDNLQLINSLANAELYITEVGDMLNTILSEAKGFKNIRWSFSPRQGNQLAHCLVALANPMEENVWLEEISREVMNVWRKDKDLLGVG